MGGYRGPKPVRESTSQLSDAAQAEMTKAAATRVFDVLKDLHGENPNMLLSRLQHHHVERIAVAAISGYELERLAQERMFRVRDELNDPLPKGWS